LRDRFCNRRASGLGVYRIAQRHEPIRSRKIGDGTKRRLQVLTHRSSSLTYGSVMQKSLRSAVVMATASLMTCLPARADGQFTFLTNWFAQAEHGGFYQALAEGTYKTHGLDVTIKMGGPQINVYQLMAAGQAD